MFKKYFGPAFILVLLLCIAACSDSSTTNQPKPAVAAISEIKPAVESVQPPDCQLTMGWDPWEPYTYWTPDNKVSGLDVEIINLIASEAGCQVEFIQDDWMSLLSQLASGKIDFVTGASITDRRKEFALFSEPYREESFVMYIRTGEQEQFKDSLREILDDGKKIGTTTDYIYGESVSALQDDDKYASLFMNSSVSEVNYYNLVQHNIDAFIEDPFVGSYNIKRKGISDDIEQLPIQIHSGDVHLMFSKKSTEQGVVDRFNSALTNIKEDGRYSKILNKYLL